MREQDDDWCAPPEDAIDIGNGHWITYSQWAPDRDLNPQYAHLPDLPKCGCSVYHKRRNGDSTKWCTGFIHFDLPGARDLFGGEKHVWQVHSWEPLTVTPSLLCKMKWDGVECGDHGYITKGRWVIA